MPRGLLDPVARRLRQAARPADANLTDAELLRRFVAERDETAFAALVRRHGRLVRCVCRRVLDSEQDAEDAEQATLLVLARKAASIRVGTAVASWLYGVAYRIAMNARKAAARRRTYERRSEARPVEQPVSQAALRELQALLNEEVSRLPEKYRAPFVLCCLEGKSKGEAARELCCPEGTVSGRLARARKCLRQRLGRRGVTLSAALCAAALSSAGASGIQAATVRAVLAWTADRPASVPATAATLAEGVMRTMFTTRLKLLAVLFLLSGIVAAAALAAHRALAAPPSVARDDRPKKQPALPDSDRERLTEDAVAAGLQWLTRHQADDGRWSMRSFHLHANCNCTGRGMDDDVAATALALLPLLGAGETHKKTGALHPFAGNVERGLRFLLGGQKADGHFGGMMYTQALATLAVSEAYRRTADPRLKEPARRALDYIVKAQHPAGGWRYTPGNPGDTSVTVWQLLALEGGRRAGFVVPDAVRRRASTFLDSVAEPDGSGYGYVQRGQTPTMTAAGLLSRLLLGVKEPKGLKQGLAGLGQKQPGAGHDLYHDHFVTLLMEQAGGADWRRWQPRMRKWLLDKQDQGNDAQHRHQRGSWAPQGERHAEAGGRLLTTSLALLALESCARSDTPFRPRPQPLSATELKSLWIDLAGDNFARARRGMQVLAVAPGRSVPFLKEQLKPVPPPDEVQLVRLIGALDAQQFSVRERAAAELLQIGGQAVPALRAALGKRPSLEVRRRLEQTLAAIERAGVPERRRRLRVLEVLVQAGGPEARALLKALAGGYPAADLTAAAKAALKRLPEGK